MISNPTRKDLTELQTFNKAFCLTVYVPVVSRVAATNPNAITMKNVVREAEHALSSAGVDVHDITKTLQPLHQMIEAGEFWSIRHGSIALFMHATFFRCYQLPDVALHGQVLQTGFDVKPLEQVVKHDQQYYVLALGHKNVRMFEGDRYALKPIRLTGLPANMKESLGIDEYPKSRELHAIAPTNRGKGSSAFHEQYDVSQTDKAMLKEFFRWVDRHIHGFLLQHQKPLVLAGVNYLLPIYRSVNTYPGLVGESITGNQDNPDLQQLRNKAWSLIEQNLDRKQ